MQKFVVTFPHAAACLTPSTVQTALNFYLSRSADFRGAKVEEYRPASILPRPLEDYTTPCPEGWDTVVGYLAKHRPEVIAALGEAAEVTQRDGFWLMHRTRERGLPVVWVRASRVLQEQDVMQVRAWPVDLLSERLGA